MKIILRKIRFFFFRSRYERELAEEMRLHVEMKTEEKKRQGLGRADADLAAQRDFGNLMRAQEECR